MPPNGPAAESFVARMPLGDASWSSDTVFASTLGDPGTPIQAFDQDDWVVALHYEKRNVRDSLARFNALREATLRLLKTLTLTQWKQYGMHAERGEESIETMVHLMAGHELNHIAQIERIIALKM